jgi:uncharacterized Fe-S cluster-containing radical SAM superfamily protein
MPKGAVHHLHLTAAAPIETLIKITYQDNMYYNDKKKLFKVGPKGLNEEGFIKINDLRAHWASPEEFDDYLKGLMLLSDETIKKQESHAIWKDFEPKFIMTNGSLLINQRSLLL